MEIWDILRHFETRLGQSNLRVTIARLDPYSLLLKGEVVAEILADRLVTFNEAARIVGGSSGKGVHPSTIWRWTLRGCQGIRLESFLIGGKRMTSHEALNRFLNEINR